MKLLYKTAAFCRLSHFQRLKKSGRIEHGREICWFLSRIPFYEEKGCTFEESIDFAVDDCLTEGILFSFFQRRRETVKALLLKRHAHAPSAPKEPKTSKSLSDNPDLQHLA